MKQSSMAAMATRQALVRMRTIAEAAESFSNGQRQEIEDTDI
jgi:hypothetical protein